MDMEHELAHISEDRTRTQTVLEHAEGTARRAAEFASVFDSAPLAHAAGMAHDLGKYSKAFQHRLLDDGPKVDHSTAGAVELARRGMDLAAFAAMGHHTGLPDGGSMGADTPDRPTYYGRLKGGVSGRIPDYSAWQGRFPLDRADPPAFCGRDALTDSFFIRMLYYCLVDADYLDTEAFMRGGDPGRGGYEDIPALLVKLERHIASWLENREADTLNGRRSGILRACLAGAEGAPGLYSLTVPTGGGKTVASLAFALRHAALHGLRRVIYVIPYTSIIEQTADVFRDIVGPDQVVEHHSNVDFSVDEGGRPEDYRRALSTENWDAPIVVTTAVQFFESLYANRSSRCRKLHNIAGSVVVFDEAQMLPIPYLAPCLAAIAQLVEHYRATAVLCTATQPALDARFQKVAPGRPIRELVPDTQRLYELFRRVNLRHEGTLDDGELAQRLNGHTAALCIVNSRRQAQEVYAKLEGEGRFHLSTLMYPAHRRAVLRAIRQRLRDGLPCRVVSTSLIEAGVDVDFPTVYRAEAGLDSILQAAGRCNRENRRSREESVVHIFCTDAPTPPLFQANTAAFRMTEDQYDDIGSPAAIRSYFTTLQKLKGEEGLDKSGILDAFARGIDGSVFPFATVAGRFQLIDTQTKTVYIPLGKGAELVSELLEGKPSRRLMRQLGQYAVNVYSPNFKALLETGDITLLDEESAVLENLGLYDQQMGLPMAVDMGKALFILDQNC